MSTRRDARERAIGLLYEAEIKATPGEVIVEELPIPAQEYAETIVAGVDVRQAEIDALLVKYAEGWSLERMPAIDRAILRMATYELIGEDATPMGVILNEAVELASEYSTTESGRFVNGVLAAIAAEVRD